MPRGIKILSACLIVAMVPMAAIAQAIEQSPNASHSGEWSATDALRQYQHRLLSDPLSNLPRVPPKIPPLHAPDPESLLRPVSLEQSINPDSPPAFERVEYAALSQRSFHEAHADPELSWIESVRLSDFALIWSKHRLTTTFLAGSDKGLGFTSIDLRTQFAPKHFPLLQWTPRFTGHFLDRSEGIDLPSEIYETAIDFSFFLPLGEKWSLLGGVAPGLYTDFNNVSSDAVRITARGLAFYKYSDRLRFAVGFVYLDRDDVTALPVAGVTWTPQQYPDLTFDIMFPRPRILYRLAADGKMEKRIYLAGEFGGGTWAIQQRSGLDNVATYSDLKLALGIESVESATFSWFLETGYVFNRSLEFSNSPKMDLDETGMVRVGLNY